jgi:hypothetical protein
MRIVQLLRGVGGEAHVVHTFVTDEAFPLEVYNPMLEDYDLALVEGLGLQATPIGKVVGKFIELELRARTEAEQTEREAREITAEHVKAIAAATPMTLSDAAAALAMTMTAPPPPPRVPAGHIDPRTTALGASRAPMPHRGDGTTREKPSDDLIIRPGRADGLGKTEVLEVRDGQLVKAPGWKPVQFEGEAVERASGPTEVLNENT